jgi:hypothetical protein
MINIQLIKKQTASYLYDLQQQKFCGSKQQKSLSVIADRL